VCVCIDEIRREKRPKERERKRYIIRSSSQVNIRDTIVFFFFFIFLLLLPRQDF
jgi:hypothetical protein